MQPGKLIVVKWTTEQVAGSNPHFFLLVSFFPSPFFLFLTFSFVLALPLQCSSVHVMNVTMHTLCSSSRGGHIPHQQALTDQEMVQGPQQSQLLVSPTYP